MTHAATQAVLMPMAQMSTITTNDVGFNEYQKCVYIMSMAWLL